MNSVSQQPKASLGLCKGNNFEAEMFDGKTGKDSKITGNLEELLGYAVLPRLLRCY